ncbi:MAG TPA: redoxin family protein [Polyangia bacterium]
MRLGRLSILAPVAAAAALAAGCGAPTDPTPNRPPPATGDYPPGPYGYGQGTTIANLEFIGKESPTATDYSMLPMQPLALGDVRKNAKLILIDGAARWCTPCNRDQPTMRNIEATYAAKGVTTMEILVEGGYGIAATDNDINRWAQQYQLAGIIAIDPSYELAKYADVTAFPVYMVVRASTMRVDYMQVASLAASPIEPVLDQLLAQ